MRARHIVEEFVKTRFRQPENFDKVAEGTGWVLYAGGNDWENCATAAAVIFPSNEENARLWLTIKFPKELEKAAKDSGSEQAKECRTYAEKAWRAWAQAAKGAHHGNGSRSWLDAFKSAVHSEAMRPYIEEWGSDRTRWADERPVGESIVETLLR